MRLEGLDLDPGDWDISIDLDGENAVEELNEGNNQASDTIPIRTMVKNGPAYYPKGALDGELLVIKYDDVEGALPDGSASCAIAWGVNGWMRPTRVPLQSVGVATRTETVMERGPDGLWWVYIPTHEAVKWVDFKFRNGQVTGDVMDDNSGLSWIVPTESWAVEAVEDLRDAILDAHSLGVDTAAYDSILSAAAQHLGSADFAAVVEVIGNRTLVVYRSAALEVLGAAEEALADAVQDGIVLGRAEIMLNAAGNAIQNGNYAGARSYCGTVLSLIQKARSEVGESMIAFLGLVGLGLASRRIRRRRR
jgi:hypothetical protein